MRRILLVALLSPLLTGCPRPASPDTDRPPEPQAGRSDMRQAIQAPMDRAKAVQATIDAAAGSQRAAIDAQAD